MMTPFQTRFAGCLFGAVVVGVLLMMRYAEYLEQSVHYMFSPRVRSRLKILVSFSQIIYALPNVFEMPFPPVFEDFLVSVMRCGAAGSRSHYACARPSRPSLATQARILFLKGSSLLARSRSRTHI